MGMGFAPTRLRQVSPPASQNHFNHWSVGASDWLQRLGITQEQQLVAKISKTQVINGPIQLVCV